MSDQLDIGALRALQTRRASCLKAIDDAAFCDNYTDAHRARVELHEIDKKLLEAAPALLDAAEENAKLRARVEAEHAERLACDRAAYAALADVDERRAERDALRAELSWIDSVLARRPALDKPTRAANIEHAINVAKQADALRAEVAKLQLSASDVEFHGNEQVKALRAENERLREALTPSGATKAAYHGEFGFELLARDGEGVDCHMVPWTTIKEIMAAISKRAALRPTEGEVKP